jgi:hypothetical protein
MNEVGLLHGEAETHSTASSQVSQLNAERSKIRHGKIYLQIRNGPCIDADKFATVVAAAVVADD